MFISLPMALKPKWASDIFMSQAGAECSDNLKQQLFQAAVYAIDASARKERNISKFNKNIF